MSTIERAEIKDISLKQKIPMSQRPLLQRAAYYTSTDVISFIAGPFIRHWTETVDKGTSIEVASDFDDKFAEAVENDCLIVYEANHASTYDAEALALVNDATKEATNAQETLLPMAKSQITGDQGFWNFVQYKSTRKLLNKHHIRPIPTTTARDQGSRNMDANPKEYASNMKNGTKNGTPIAVLPEASVEGGRINPDTGKLNGMIAFDPNVLRMNYLLARRQGRVLAIEPVSITNSNIVLDPNTKFPQRKALLAGFHHGDPHIVSIYIGAPIRSDRELAPYIKDHNWKGASDFIAREIARHLPKDQRGVYAS